MLRIAIYEDDPQHIEDILALISKYQAIRPKLSIHTYRFDSGQRLLEHWDNGQVFNLFLFEVLMPGMSGIELAKELRLRGENSPLAFLTSSADHALDAFRVCATQYILKPITEKELFPILDQITVMQDRKEDKYLLLSSAERMVKTPFSSIVCVESINRTLQVYLADRTKLESKTIRVPFVTAVAPLLHDERFLHAHNSFVLNMDWVKEMSVNGFVMEDGTKVPVPRYKLASAKTKYLDYLSAKGVNLIDSQRYRTHISATL